MSQFDEELRRGAAPLADEPLSPDILDARLDEPVATSRWAGVVVMASGVLAVVAVGIGVSQVARIPESIDPAASSDVANGPLTASVEESGVRLTLTLDRESAVFGERVWAEVIVENVGQDAVTYRSGGADCPWPTAISVSPETLGTLDLGRDDWPGDLGALKHALTPEPIASFQHRAFIPEERVDSEHQGCFLAGLAPELPPGASLTHRAAWDTDDYLGMPPRPGPYTVELTFGFTRVGRFEPVGQSQLLRVTLPLLVEGEDVDWVSGEEAIDALLGDEIFTDHLATHAPRDRWTSQDIAFDDDRWIVTLKVGTTAADPDPRVTLVGVVDARTGVVLDVELESSATPEG